MNRTTFEKLEQYMQSCMRDSAHDREHVYRVLYHALQIAETETGVREDILIAACLLHDIGRQAQLADPAVCHALAGGGMAYEWLRKEGFPQDFADQVRHCIETHRFRSDRPPRTTEAKILFDADKLDAAGAMGIARTLQYQGKQDWPLYVPTPEGVPDETARGTFFREYREKLSRLYDRFCTTRGAELAAERRSAAEAFFQSLKTEITQSRREGQRVLNQLFAEEGVYHDGL